MHVGFSQHEQHGSQGILENRGGGFGGGMLGPWSLGTRSMR